MPEGSRRTPDIIVSSSNPGIKMVRSLQRRKYRQQERAFVVEGLRAVGDVLAAGVRPRAMYVREDVDLETLADWPLSSSPRRVATAVFNQLTDVAHPQGILAVVPIPDDAPFPDARDEPLVMVLDGVRDPGNMGTLFRSAAGAGVDHLVIGPECVDPYHPRAVRAGMGAHVRIPLSQRSWDDLGPLLASFDVVALADAAGEVTYDEAPWTASAAIIIGGEAFGPTSRAHAHATHRVAIPLARGVESLNAGVAGSLLGFEAARQRRSVHAPK